LLGIVSVATYQPPLPIRSLLVIWVLERFFDPLNWCITSNSVNLYIKCFIVTYFIKWSFLCSPQPIMFPVLGTFNPQIRFFEKEKNDKICSFLRKKSGTENVPREIFHQIIHSIFPFTHSFYFLSCVLLLHLHLPLPHCFSQMTIRSTFRGIKLEWRVSLAEVPITYSALINPDHIDFLG